MNLVERLGDWLRAVRERNVRHCGWLLKSSASLSSAGRRCKLSDQNEHSVARSPMRKTREG